MDFVPVIISGGIGSRLWPASRSDCPKPFLELPDGSTLLRKTLARAVAFDAVKDVITVTNREFLVRTAHEYSRVEMPRIRHTILLEPEGRNTAAAVALATLHAYEAHGPDSILLILPADHLIEDVSGFHRAVSQATAIAPGGRIVTFGIKPTSPETGFGYIEAKGDRVVRFIEKPDAANAERYVASGYFWNSGMFCFSARTMIDALRRHSPDLLEQVRDALSRSQKSEVSDRMVVEVDKDAFASVPSISLDYAVMEKADNVGFVPCHFDWSDVGSWNAISQLVAPDENGNRFIGAVLAHDSAACFVQSADRLVALVGLQDLLVIDTPDALLIAHKDRAQDVRMVYDRLKSEGQKTGPVPSDAGIRKARRS